MPVTQVQPGPIPTASLGSNVPVNQLGGNLGEGVVSELHGKYYNLARAGLVFHGSTAAAGVLIPISSTTSPTFALWNPGNSGHNVVLIAYKVGWVGTTGAPGSILYMVSTGVGSNIATGAPISAFTAGTPQNGLVGGGANSTSKFTPSAATIAAAGTVFGCAGFSQLTTTGTATFGTVELIDYLDGTIILPPGTLLYTAGSAALLSAFMQTFIWSEIPV